MFCVGGKGGVFMSTSNQVDIVALDDSMSAMTTSAVATYYRGDHYSDDYDCISPVHV